MQLDVGPDRKRLAAAARLQATMHAVATRVAPLSPESLETRSVAELLAGPVAEIQAAVDEAVEALGAAIAAWGETSEPGDVAFLARWELRCVQRTLAALGQQDAAVRVLDAVGTARNRLLFSLDGVERVLCAGREQQRLLASLTEMELRRSLALREGFAALRDLVRGGADDEVLASRLAEVERHLARMQGARGLRIGDRLQVRGLLARVQAALAGTGERPRSLWKDLEAFAELVVEVNRRAELLAHDQRLVVDTLRALPPAREAYPPLSIGLQRDLRRIRGRDAHLDQLLAQPAPSVEALRAGLESLRGRLAPPPASEEP